MGVFSIFDIVILIPVVVGLIRGFSKGFAVEFATLLALILGVWGAFQFSDYTAGILTQQLSWNTPYIGIISFVVTFIVIVVVVNIIGKAIDGMMEAASLGIINKLMGAVFGALKAAFIIGVLLLIFDAANSSRNWIKEDKLEKSLLYYPFVDAAHSIAPLELIDTEALEKLKDKIPLKKQAEDDKEPPEA